MNLDRLLDALRAGRYDGHAISGWIVYAAETRRTGVGTKDSVTGGPHAPLSVSESLTARYKLVWDDGRVSRGSMERRAIEREPGPILAAARAASFPDPDAIDVPGESPIPDIPMHGAGAAAVAFGAIEEFAPRLAAIRASVAESGIRTWSGSMQAALGGARVVTSSGLDVLSSGTSISWSATFDGELSGGHAAREIEPVSDLIDRLGRLAQLTLALRAPSRVRPDGVVPVLLHPDVVEDYVFGVLLHNLDGAQVAHGLGAFRKDQFDATTPALREDLSFRHDPLVPMAAGAYRFSQEGIPASACVYIDRGKLRSPVLDLKYARRLGRRPTSIPGAMDTLFFEGGPSLSYEEALASASGGALVLGVLGVHTQDFTSGDFSLAAPQTLAIGEAGFHGRLRATISGNVFEILRANELALVRFPGEHTPGLLTRCALTAA
jgi:PmbA protein